MISSISMLYITMSHLVNSYNMRGGRDVFPLISNYTNIEDMDALQEDIVQIQTVAEEVGLDQTGAIKEYISNK